MKTQQKRKQNELASEDDTLTGDEPVIKVQIVETPPPNNELEITIMDINDSGMGITCLIPLKVGQHVLFNTPQDGWDLPRKGIVMWTFKTNYRFRAGIKFIQ